MMIELVCSVCEKSFTRKRGEHNRNLRIGRKPYCSPHCTGVGCQGTLPKNIPGVYPEFGGKRYTGRDEVSPFKRYVTTAKMHAKQRKGTRQVTITPQDLKAQWEKQQGRCPYTGWELVGVEHSNQRAKISPVRASLDRIDSDGHYTPDNVQFVSYMANVAKHRFPEADLLKFCKAVVDHLFH